MRVFVTGAAGFIGGAVVRQLVRRGHEVAGLARDAESAAAVQRNGATPVVGDMNDQATLERGLLNAQAVVHAASPAPPTGPFQRGRWHTLIEQKTQATELLVESALRARVQVFVMTGGAQVARPREPGGWVNETVPPGSHSPVSRWVLDPENVVRLARHERKLPAVFMRPAFAYGNGGRFGRLIVPQLKAGNFFIPGKGDYWWSVAHVDDVAEAYALALEQAPIGETFLVVDDEPVQFKDFLAYVAELLKVRPPRSLPLWLARIIPGPEIVEEITVNACYSNAKIKRELDWEPRYKSYREGVPVALAEIASG
jgi:nucleoside-diphosphate-sugar epimerase